MWVAVSHLQDGRNKSVLGIVGGGGNYPERRLAQSSLFPAPAASTICPRTG
jgi:hypothetical protein